MVSVLSPAPSQKQLSEFANLSGDECGDVTVKSRDSSSTRRFQESLGGKPLVSSEGLTWRGALGLLEEIPWGGSRLLGGDVWEGSSSLRSSMYRH
ncbi:hypothetical protein Acr_12g0008690 [Actinidia rufa]|uniref:Uncharacterized protein n=1 Tax=Actinidia rufa TaxID=165716 RepID=A0A7J0FHZ9_9ERIC|nr:hypothetical protein Acr_12g0008690 [Actinidia rufa]